MSDDEEWRPVVGWEGLYEVSDRGRVKGLPVRARNNRHLPERFIAGRKHPKGYVSVELRHNGQPKQVLVHRLVCIAFNGDRSAEGLDVCHKNEVKDDNRKENLEWGTRSHNIKQYAESGRYRNQNSHKTHCKRGHEFTEENTRIDRGRTPNSTQRTCRTCEKDRISARRKRG